MRIPSSSQRQGKKSAFSLPSGILLAFGIRLSCLTMWAAFFSFLFLFFTLTSEVYNYVKEAASCGIPESPHTAFSATPAEDTGSATNGRSLPTSYALA